MKAEHLYPPHASLAGSAPGIDGGDCCCACDGATAFVVSGVLSGVVSLLPLLLLLLPF